MWMMTECISVSIKRSKAVYWRIAWNLSLSRSRYSTENPNYFIPGGVGGCILPSQVLLWSCWDLPLPGGARISPTDRIVRWAPLRVWWSLETTARQAGAAKQKETLLWAKGSLICRHVKNGVAPTPIKKIKKRVRQNLSLRGEEEMQRTDFIPTELHLLPFCGGCFCIGGF